MTKVDLYISKDAPQVWGTAAWLKPVSGGYALYVLDGGWKPLKIVGSNDSASEKDNTVQSIIGSVQDTKDTNTINGAKAYAKDQTDALKGNSSDGSSDMTLYGLKAYIDEQIEGLSN